MKKSNRILAKRLRRLSGISFCGFSKKQILTYSMLRIIPFDLHDLYPGKYIYRALINESSGPFDSVSRIAYNPNPTCVSRANIIGQGVAYYACAADISIIEVCRNALKNSEQREFELTVSKWKVEKKLSIQIICNALITQTAGTDLVEYYKATRSKRKKELPKRKFRTWFLKTRFLAEQYAKNSINCDNDYLISALHSNTVLKSINPLIDGIVYPSVPYVYKGFNYAFSPRLFKESYFNICEVTHVKAKFDTNDILIYPELSNIKITNSINGNKILWL